MYTFPAHAGLSFPYHHGCGELRMNDTYKKIRVLISVLTDEHELDDVIQDAVNESKLPISKSKLLGWRVGREHRSYRQMQKAELNELLDALITYYKQ